MDFLRRDYNFAQISTLNGQLQLKKKSYLTKFIKYATYTGKSRNNKNELFSQTLNEWMNESFTFQYIYIFTREIDILYIRHTPYITSYLTKH